MSDLFRAQVIELQTNRLHGDVLILPRTSHTLILGLLLLWSSCFLWWLINSNYSRKETVFGWLEPYTGVTRIYADEPGIIHNVLVQEGEKVLVNQPLLIIKGERFLSDGEKLENRLLSEYETQQRILNEQLFLTNGISKQRQQYILHQIKAAKQDLDLLDVQLKTLKARFELINENLDRQQTLEQKGFISQSEIEALIVQKLALHYDLQSLLREKLGQSNYIEKLKSDLRILPNQTAYENLQLQISLSEISQKIVQVYGQRTHVVKASRSGYINNLQAQAGQQVYVGNSIPLLTVIPVNYDLAAHLLVPIRSAAFVEPGQELDIRYDAFPFQKFGIYRGKVVSISDNVLMPNEILNSPLNTQEPVFRVTANLKQSQVHAYGKEYQLKPGMTLSADVRLGERSLIEWILEPIYSLKGRL